jgi:DNA-binding NarL/FixJ family response regulator
MHPAMSEPEIGRAPLAIGLVEDDRRLREVLVYLLESTPGFRVVGDWPSAESLLGPRAIAEPPDLLLLDIQLPGMSGIEALEPLRQRFPEMTVLMLTVFEDEERIFQSLCRGAHGYLLKETPPQKLIELIREADAGGSPMSPEIARRVVTLFRNLAPPAPPEHGLSPRQVDLLALLADGHSYQSAAVAMGVSINTVRSYIRIIYQKLHVQSRSAAVAEALRSRVI